MRRQARSATYGLVFTFLCFFLGGPVASDDDNGGARSGGGGGCGCGCVFCWEGAADAAAAAA